MRDTGFLKNISDKINRLNRDIFGGYFSPVNQIETDFISENVSSLGAIRAVTIDSEKSIIAGDSNSKLAKWTKEGELLWFIESVDPPGTDRTIYNIGSDSENGLYLGTNYNKVHKIDGNGNIEWTFDSHDGAVRDLYVDRNDHIYTVGGRFLFKLDKNKNILWTYELATGSVGLSVTVDKLGFVYAHFFVDGVGHRTRKLDQSGADSTTSPTLVWEDSDSITRLWLSTDDDGNVYYVRGGSLFKRAQLADDSGLESVGYAIISVSQFEVTGGGDIYVNHTDKQTKINADREIVWQKDQRFTSGFYAVTTDMNENPFFSSANRIEKIQSELKNKGYRNESN